MPFDLDRWKQWEGQSVDSLFQLERCIGGSSRGAVFETQFEGRPAAIKLVPGTPDAIAAHLALWEKTSGLSDPTLIRSFKWGETALGDMRCAYIVMERADENLAEVLVERPLTPTETRDMLFPVLAALKYLDAKGFAHGRLKPANLMAVGEQLKISSDSLVPGGDPADDCRAIGVLLQDVLSANQNTNLPEPFAEIASNCLAPDPAARWNVTQIEARLRSNPAPAAPTKSRVKWWLLAAAVVILAMVAAWPSLHNSSDQSAAAPAPPAAPENIAPTAPPVSPQADVQPPVKPKAPAEPPAKTAAETKPVNPPVEVPKAPTEQTAATIDGITQVLPDIPQFALNTITGRVRINVRVSVDGAGNVSQTTLEPPRASKYFNDRVLTAAQAWKFPAGNTPQDWVLHFELTHGPIRVSVAKITN